MKTTIFSMGLAVLLLAGCGASQEEQEREALRAMLEEATKEPARYVPVDGEATRPLFPEELEGTHPTFPPATPSPSEPAQESAAAGEESPQQ